MMWFAITALGLALAAVHIDRGGVLPLSFGEACALWVWLVTIGALAWVRANKRGAR